MAWVVNVYTDKVALQTALAAYGETQVKFVTAAPDTTGKMVYTLVAYT